MLMRTDPFRELDRLSQQLLGTLGTTARPAAMPMDAWRAGDEFIVEFDLPGVDPATVELDAGRRDGPSGRPGRFLPPASTSSAVLSAVWRATSGSTLVYVSAVSTMLACPSMSWMALRSAPDARADVAAPCRRSWKRIGDSRWQQHRTTAVFLQGPADRQGCLVEIDVGPAQPGRFAAAQPAQRDQLQQRAQPVLLDGGEEPGSVGGRWTHHRLTTASQVRRA